MNICSNQIKEVILHRFKVNSLQKLLIHINFLLAFSVLFCSHSAFGQPSVRTQWPQNKNWTIVDLGQNISVYWADKNVKEFINNSYVEKYFTWQEAKDWNSSHNYQGWVGYWRTPTKSELEELKNLQQSRMTANPGGVRLTSSNGYFIDIPASGWYDKHGTYEGNGLRSYLWSSTQWDIWPYDRAYYLIYYDTWPYDLDVYTGNPDSKLPIRPVIDKCSDVTIVAKYDGQTTTISSKQSYPKGSLIITENDDCYDHKCYEVIGSSVSSVRNEVSDSVLKSNVTYEVVFTKKTYTVTTQVAEGQSSYGQVTQFNNPINCGTEVTITATPDDCYVFDKWDDGNTSNTRTEVITTNKTYTAYFSIKTTDIVATTEDNRKGTVGILEPINN